MTEPVYLLDVNVLVAMVWPQHAFHARTNEWFETLSRPRWATCCFTEAAFVRLLSNSSFASPTLTTLSASDLLVANLQRAGHQFWPVDISFAEAIAPFSSKIAGYRQVTDAYLLGLAIHRRGKLATMDRAISTLLPRDEAHSYITQI
ncbi:MAG TPA: TA system VapC family ribonuclease toxin [Acidisarcina sp.]